jgi:hypothetical protein
VGAGERTSLLGLIELVGTITGRTLAYGLPARDGDARDSLPSLERVERLPGYRRLVSLCEGLRRPSAWFERRPRAAGSRRQEPAGEAYADTSRWLRRSSRFLR